MALSISTEQAETIVSEYGKLLSETKPSIYGIPKSLLPYEKEQIKIAIQSILLSLSDTDEKIHEGLTQAYVYLAQFIDDEKVAIAENGREILEKGNKEKNIEELELANQAVQTINGIKSDMENLINELRLLIS